MTTPLKTEFDPFTGGAAARKKRPALAEAGEIRRIAVLRALQLGDLLCAVPAFRSLRAAFPAAEIVLIGLPWARAFAARFPLLFDGFMEFPGMPGLPERAPDLKAFPRFLAAAQEKAFDLAVQLHGSGSHVNILTALLGARRCAGFYMPDDLRPDPSLFMPWPGRGTEVQRCLALTEFLGAPPCGEALEFPLTAEDRSAFSELGVPWNPGGYVCVHPGAQLPSRRWPPERFAAVADALAAEGLRVVVTGCASEREVVRAVLDDMRTPALDLCGATTLGTLAVLLEGAKALISNDTGLSHMAAALRTPSVIVASGSDVGRWSPADRGLHRMVYHPIGCRPCTHAVCPIGHPCAREIPASTVVREALTLLKGAARGGPDRRKEEGRCAA